MAAVVRSRNREMAAAKDTSGGLPVNQKACRCVDDPHLAFVVDKEVVKAYAQRQGPAMKAHREVSFSSLMEGSDATISVLTEDQ